MTGFRARRRGFTLVELLTVAGIAIVLSTLVVAAMYAAQEAARNANCRTNLSQLHKLMMTYTHTYGQFLPAMWHERWVGELGLSGGKWRADLQKQKQKSYIKYMWDQWALFLKTPGAKTFPPPSAVGSSAPGYTYWNNIRKRMGDIYKPGGYEPRYENIDDVNPLMPAVWNNYQDPGHYLGLTPWVSGYANGARTPATSGAPSVRCPSDTSDYRCDQGPIVSYMGLAKYGWWHRGGTDTISRYYEYHQIQEVTNFGSGILLSESEPGTWQYGGCG